MYKQIIIVRKDLDMSPGKLAAQVSHASMAFLTNKIKQSNWKAGMDGKNCFVNLWLDIGTFEQWICGEFTKVILEARNKNQLLKAVKMAEELGMEEYQDFFLIKDNCRTELTPEEDGRTLTCIGFRPMDAEVIDKIGKKYQLLT